MKPGLGDSFRGCRNTGDSDRIQPCTESSEFSNQSKCSYVKKNPPCGASANHPESGRIRPFTESSEFSNPQPRMKPTLNAPGTNKRWMRVNVIHCFHFCCSNVAFNFNLRRYSKGSPIASAKARPMYRPGSSSVMATRPRWWRPRGKPARVRSFRSPSSSSCSRHGRVVQVESTWFQRLKLKCDEPL